MWVRSKKQEFQQNVIGGGGVVAESCPTLATPMDGSLAGSSVHGDSLSKNTGVGCHALLQGNLLNPGMEPRSPALQADSLPSEPPVTFNN